MILGSLGHVHITPEKSENATITSLLCSRYLCHHATLLRYVTQHLFPLGDKRCVTTQITVAEESKKNHGHLGFAFEENLLMEIA